MKEINNTSHIRFVRINDGFSITILPKPKDPIAALYGKYKNSRLDQTLADFRTRERAHDRMLFPECTNKKNPEVR